jgi:hypothetical protein
MVVALVVASKCKSNFAKGTSSWSVGQIIVFKHLNVGSELNAHGVVVGGRSTRKDGYGTHGL